MLKHKIYFGLNFIYLLVVIKYTIFLLQFNCDGLGCLSIALFTGPITLTFLGIFLVVSIKAVRIFKDNENHEAESIEKLDRLLKRSQIPFYLFTAILLFKLIY